MLARREAVRFAVALRSFPALLSGLTLSPGWDRIGVLGCGTMLGVDLICMEGTTFKRREYHAEILF